MGQAEIAKTANCFVEEMELGIIILIVFYLLKANFLGHET